MLWQKTKKRALDKFECMINEHFHERNIHFDNCEWNMIYKYDSGVSFYYQSFDNKSDAWSTGITFNKSPHSGKGIAGFDIDMDESIGFSIHPKIDTNNTCEETTPIIDALLPGKQYSQLWEKCLVLFTKNELEDIYDCLVGVEDTWQTAANDILDVYDEFKNKRKIFYAPFGFMPDNILNVYKQRAQNTSISQNINKSCQTAYNKQNVQEMTNKPHKLTAGEIMAKGQELIDNGCAVVH